MTLSVSAPIVPMGLSGMLVNFGQELSDDANRAALAFRAGIDAQGWDWVTETTTSLTSAMVLFDPLAIAQAEVLEALRALRDSRDWTEAPWPQNRRFWRVPACFEGEDAPQLAEAAALAGVSKSQAIDDLCAGPVRVLTLGFAPGQPYLGSLAPHWNIPRQTGLTGQVPAGAITVAIRQIVLFANPSPTGWRQAGRCHFPLYRPQTARPFTLQPGDEVAFYPVSALALREAAATDPTGYGGATYQALT